MELSSLPIQSYQRNQTHADSLLNIEHSPKIKDSKGESIDEQLDDVVISPQSDVYKWVANEYPVDSENSATISRASQALYEYQVLDFKDIQVINTVLSDKEEQSVLSKIDTALETSASYIEQKSLNHIKRVFMTLVAAQE